MSPPPTTTSITKTGVCARAHHVNIGLSLVSNSRFLHRDQSRLSPCIGAEVTRTLRAVSHNKVFSCLFLFIFSTVIIFFPGGTPRHRSRAGSSETGVRPQSKPLIAAASAGQAAEPAPVCLFYICFLNSVFFPPCAS